VNTGYTTEQFLHLQDQLLLSAQSSAQQSLWTCLDLLLRHYLFLCGDNRQAAELSELFVLQYPASKGPTPCWVLVLQNEQSKTNQQGDLLYSGAMRHWNPRLCTMGALAQYLFWRWHISGEPALNFQRRQD
jgi:hypothetical protein